jgi:SAM-dependent methyltransferase
MARVDFDELAATYDAARTLPPEALEAWREALAAWLSVVVHHLADLPAAAEELRRVLVPGGRVLIRGAFPGRHQHLTLFG